MQSTVFFIILALTLTFFIWGKFRYDIVALGALLAVVFTGLLPKEQAFTGFSNPAVISVAAILVVSQGLVNSGVIDRVSKKVREIKGGMRFQIIVLSSIVAIASAFMNNIGAMAIFMPIAIQIARANEYPVSKVLMPLAFASILGGLNTLIGTPPNIIISSFKKDRLGEAFGMFEFAQIGLPLTIIGLIFITTVGLKLLPRRKGNQRVISDFGIDTYVSELKIREDSPLLDKTFQELEQEHGNDVNFLGIIRNGERIRFNDRKRKLIENDKILVEAEPEDLKSFFSSINEQKEEIESEKQIEKREEEQNLKLAEVVVMAGSPLIGSTAKEIALRDRFGIQVIAIARRSKKKRSKLESTPFKGGDVLLVEGEADHVENTLRQMKCLLLSQTIWGSNSAKKSILAVLLVLGAILSVAFGILKVEIAFVGAAFGMVVTNILPLKQVYDSIDWPVVVLLGAMIPVGMAFETSGAASLITQMLLDFGENWEPWLIMAVLMIITMLLSDVLNNAATVVLMAPIGFKIAESLSLSTDPFLMAVAVGGSCAFLTPIGHQSNTLVLGPGSYRFSDYWKLGLPLEVLIVATATPLIPIIWPF
ncbi:MAG: SLC13 family permease [Cyclobacteriaceae bacterium]|nr:SLC13 family permease [Cyclobacteriaceae bacterium]MCH8516282.1 SLC13 family permease [Cyclobacteriaceae bacterium]